MLKQEPQSVVDMQTYANGNAEITVTGKGGMLILEVFTGGPSIAIHNPVRGQHPLKAAVSLKANGHLRGFFVEKKGDDPGNDTLVWFPARKKRAKKQPTKKRTPKA